MHLRRGTHPVYYHLLSEGEEVGTIASIPDGAIHAAFCGFRNATAAASAAWLAHGARPGGAGELVPPADVQNLSGRDEGTSIVLRLGGEEIARLRTIEDAKGGPPCWCAELPIGRVDTPEVFALGIARRMWEAIRRAGLWRQMVQWAPPVRPAPSSR